VETVIPYFDRFMSELPTVSALAEAPTDRVMSLWSGLGYYRRARMLHESAQALMTTGAALPTTARELAAVRGIGRYTAGAIASIAFGERAALVDGNVARVLARLFAVPDDVRAGRGLAKVWKIAELLVPEGRAGAWNQSLMELGRTVCTPRSPACLACPALRLCDARAKRIEGELPVLRPKGRPTAVEMSALVATVGARVLVVRRKSGGLFGGLWEPPMVENGPETATPTRARRLFQTLLGVPLPVLRPHGEVAHVLSHRRIEATVWSVRLRRAPAAELGDGSPYDGYRVVDREALGDLGVSAFARKVFDAAGVVGRRLRSD
jgi:A/G-specific adenine glycosylase